MPSEVTSYLEAIVEMASDSGGGMLEPQAVTSNVGEDWEDDRMLDLVLAADADFFVTEDGYFLRNLNGWRGCRMETADDFAGRAATTRLARKAPRPSWER